jgi:aldehyde dehydrogenase (NAD+)
LRRVRHGGVHRKKIAASVDAFRAWRDVPAPRRGELVRLFGEELRANKDTLGRLVTLEAARFCRKASAKCRR